MPRKGHGCFLIGDYWYVRPYEPQLVEGVVQTKRVAHRLGPNTGRSRKNPPADILELAERFRAAAKTCSIRPEHITSVADFGERVFLPWAETYNKPSTAKTYRDAWNMYIKPTAENEPVLLKDIRCCHVQGWLDLIATSDLNRRSKKWQRRRPFRPLGRNSIKRLKSVISSMFRLAKQRGYYDGVNPAKDTSVSPTAAPARETHAYNLEQINAILGALDEPAATIFAVAAFAGLRRGELQALNWEDYRDGKLHVVRSCWEGQIGTTKTVASAQAIPVIKQLRDRLEFHRLRCGNPQIGPVFVNLAGHRLSITNLVTRVIRPCLARCKHCGRPKGQWHLLRRGHEYERNDHLPEWHGFHAARRGLGSNLYRLGVPDKVIQRILRHSNVNVTLSYYIKPDSVDAEGAMRTLEQTLDSMDTNQPSKPASTVPQRTVN